MDVEIPGGDEIGDFLAACAKDEWLYLPGVGWLTTIRYLPYQGHDPRTGVAVSVPAKHSPFFRPDPELLGTLNGLPPSGRSFSDEHARYLHASHPEDDQDPGEESFMVRRPPWVEPVAAAIRRHLAEGTHVEVSAIGRFEVVEKPGRPGRNPDTGEPIRIPPRRIVRFSASLQLEQRLSQRA
jgi:integration host factor subunit alpha